MNALLCLLIVNSRTAMRAGAFSGSSALNSGPAVWMMPPSDENGKKFRDLFEQADGWKQTRSRITGIGYADHWLNAQFTDAELGKWLPKLSHWRLKLALEVGAIKPWGETGERTFDIERKMWDRFRRLGGDIYELAMDEPLSATRDALHQSRGYAVEQTAAFIALARRNYPEFKIGDIEPYPSIPADELLAFLDALRARVAEMGVRGVDFLRLDVDWMHFVVRDKVGQAGWAGVRDLELQCRQRGVPFSLIYWAADYPSLKRAGLATDESWEASILRQGADYAAAGGAPDESVIESWLDTPSLSVPETKTDTIN